MKRLKIVSLFSGCGGLDKGFLMTNDLQDDFKYEIVWANDIDPMACATYKENIGDHILCGDIREVNFNSLPQCDIILGGFPCQDFSVLWKRGGINTERGNLYLSFTKAIEEKKPLLFIAENVKGLLSANKGQALKQIVNDFAKRGYNLSCNLYNAADFGVAQLRERVILVGVRNDAVYKEQINSINRSPVYFPKIEPTHSKNYISSKEALKDVENVKYNNELLNIKKRTEQIIAAISPGGNFTDIPKESNLYVKGMISHVYRRLHPDRPSTTVIAAGGGGTWGYHYSEPRPLTNRERARIQSFPDDFIFKGSIAEVRRQIGNAVPPKLASAIAKNVVILLNSVVFTNNLTKNNIPEQIELAL